MVDRGGYIKKRYIELVDPEKRKDDNRTVEEIIDDVVLKSGIKVVKTK